VQPAAWRPARAGLGLLFSISRIGPSHFLLPRFSSAPARAGPKCSCGHAPSLASLTGGTRRSAASPFSVRNRAGVMVPTGRNPELHGILFQAKVSWDYLSKPHGIAYPLYVNFHAVCPSSRPQAPKTLEATVGSNSTSTSFFGYCKLFQ
jgi:hypothetical protein